MAEKRVERIIPVAFDPEPSVATEEGLRDHWAAPGMASPLDAKTLAKMSRRANPDNIGQPSAAVSDVAEGTNLVAVMSLGAFIMFVLPLVVTLVGTTFMRDAQGVPSFPHSLFLFLLMVEVVMLATSIVTGMRALREVRSTGGSQPGAGLAMTALLLSGAVCVVIAAFTVLSVLSSSFRGDIMKMLGL